MNIITKDIKMIKDLRKYVNSIDWYNKEWNEKDNEQFVQKGLICQRSTEKVNGSIENVPFKFATVFFKSAISKKKQARTYKLPFSTSQVVFKSYGRNELLDRLDNAVYKKYKDSDQTIRCYQLKNRADYSNCTISDAFIYANEFTDEILCVSYAREDIWWNNFFKDCLDASIPNNFDELNRVKKWNLVLRKEEYKTILIEEKTFQEALDNFYKNNTDFDREKSGEYQRLPNTWNVWGTTALDKLPENQNIETTNDVIKNSHMYYGSDPKELGDTRER
tara:strand:+ start:528 stop:1358 length:831 start_codon:yes stop_codon:yes gene_type:complete